ncbi:MAG: hypothetical protein ABGY96_24340 [bacterium]
MVKVRRTQNSFIAGQLDPGMRMRSDVGAYTNGVETLTNYRLLLHGGVKRRPGTKYLATLNKKSRLAKFKFSESQQYVVAFQASRIEVYGSDGALDQALTSNVPYTEAQLDEIRWAQSGDTMIVVHEDHPIWELKRTGASSFTWTEFAFEQHSSGEPLFQPYYKYAASANTLTPSATTGSGITLTLSAAHFTTDFINEIIRYKGEEILLTGFTSTTVMTGTARATLAGTTADEDWDEPAFHDVVGYPRTVRFHLQRLIFGGSKSLPDTLFCSKVGAFFNFDLGTAEQAEGIQVTIGGDHVNTIQHLVSSRHLQIFTNDGEFYVPTTEAVPFTPANVQFMEQTDFGCANVPPRKMDGVTLFPDKTGKHLREFLFSDIEQAYSSESLSKLVPDILGTPKDCEVLSGSTNHPEQYLYVINEAGGMAQLNTMRSENIAGWATWSTRTGDKFISVIEVDDEIFLCMERSINSATVYYLEQLDYTSTLDCNITKTASTTTSWTGLTVLEGESVDVFDNTKTTHGGTYTVASGNITTLNEHTNIDVGFDIITTIVDLPPAITLSTGGITGEMKRIAKINLSVIDSYTWTIGNDIVQLYQTTDDLSAAPVAKNGIYEFFQLGFDKLAQTTITQDAPLPLTILGMEKEIVF